MIYFDCWGLGLPLNFVPHSPPPSPAWVVKEREEVGRDSGLKADAGIWGQDLKQKSGRLHFIALYAFCALGVLAPVKAVLSLSSFPWLGSCTHFYMQVLECWALYGSQHLSSPFSNMTFSVIQLQTPLSLAFSPREPDQGI